jgi:T5SS/PEP-CTERM-associated repeat protein
VGGSLVVGQADGGSLGIAAGGSVSATAVFAGAQTGGVGAVEVTGAGSALSTAGALVVGQSGLGSLSVAQGAKVTAASASLASGAGGDGVITVAGTGSALTLAGSLTVGGQAAGEVAVLAGATVSALDVTIGNGAALSSGDVDVEGAGSELLIGAGGLLNIGVANGGAGVLTVGTMATLNFNGTIVESGHASFNNNGGVVDPDAVQFTSSSNGGTGLNQYDLYVDNTGAVQVVSGTGTWDTPMVLTGTSLADAANNINNNGDTGQWQLSQNGTLIVNANTVDAGQAIVFEDATDTLVIGQVVNGGSAGVSGQTPTIAPNAENLLQAGGFSAEIWGFQAGDQIQFANMIVASDSVVNSNTLELFGSENVPLGSLSFFSKAGNSASAAGARAAAAQISCFAEGTLIETADGPRRVEDLAIGALIVTVPIRPSRHGPARSGHLNRHGAATGGPDEPGHDATTHPGHDAGAGVGAAAGRRPASSARAGLAPVVWIGRRKVDCARHPRPETVWPVRVRAGAFGRNGPVRDLWLSPDHAVLVDRVLVPVRLLINGSSLIQVERRSVVYYHVELPAHAVIRAEGLPVESYLDTGDRANFERSDGVIRLFPDFAARLRPDLAREWETRAAAPLVLAGRALTKAKTAVTEWSDHVTSRPPRRHPKRP